MEESTKRIAERFQCRYTVFKKGTEIGRASCRERVFDIV